MADYGLRFADEKKSEKEGPPAGRGKRAAKGCARVLLILVQLSVAVMLVGIILFVGSYIYLSNQLAGAIEQVTNYQGSGAGGTPRFFDRNGNLLFELKTTEKRRWLEYNEMTADIVQATVAVEDDTFWTNPGFDPAAIVAALISNYRNEGGRPVGASTITQQLVRHIAFSYEERVTASYQRKFREIFLAFILTQQRSKPEIMQMYLNEIYYGNLAYGIEAAAQTYFGKPTMELNLAEAAFLAGLPQSPLELDPYTNFEGAKARQELVLDLMLSEGMIDPVAANVAKLQPLNLMPRISIEEEVAGGVLEAPHYILYVQDILERRYGPDALTRDGWQVVTSLDLNIQHIAEQAAREQVAAKFAQHDVSNAAVVVLKPGTGEILAMVGSVDYFNEAIDGQVNVALHPRQPGSSIKPITYAAAMERGWTTADVLWDVPIALDLGGGEEMVPVNYDGLYHGPILLRDALANSYNIPPIQLIRDIGVPYFISTARKMGVESLTEPPGFYGLSLTLGGGEVPLLELANAYATLANGGQRPRLNPILRIIDSRGNVVYDLQTDRVPPSNALDPRIAYIITHILDDDNARVPAMGRSSDLALPFPAAVKTGTTNDFRDNWVMGYTPGMVVGVWMGNSDGHPMIDSSGLQTAAPVWRRIMETVYSSPTTLGSLFVNGAPPPRDFPRPAGIEERQVCLPAGTGGATCGAWRTDLFMTGGPTHGVARLGYVPDVNTAPGAWLLAVTSLPPEEAQRIVLAPLDNGYQPPPPTECVISGARPEGVYQRLYLPVPPFYPDEVRARLWAAQRGYVMAPPVACPVNVVRQLNAPAQTAGEAEGGSGTVPLGGGSAPVQATYHIASPTAGQQVSGIVQIRGTANFSQSEVQYYKLEIGSGRSPTEWTTFGTTHSGPVVNGVLEELHAYALVPGDYVIRLILVRTDGNFPAPYAVPITIVP